MAAAIVDGQQVTVGDVVSFKCDIEQSGVITRIKTDMMGRKVLVLENQHGFQGGYIGGEVVHTELAEECWI
jgi:hypothetical protein